VHAGIYAMQKRRESRVDFLKSKRKKESRVEILRSPAQKSFYIVNSTLKTFFFFLPVCAGVGRGVDAAGTRGFRVGQADVMGSSLGEG